MSTSATKVFVPRDTTACSLGADDIAKKVKKIIDSEQLELNLVRNGSRGLYWLEPMLEIETSLGRIAFGPVDEESVDTILRSRCW